MAINADISVKPPDSNGQLYIKQSMHAHKRPQVA